MSEDERVVAYAEAVVELENAKVEMKAFADKMWLSIYGPRY